MTLSFYIILLLSALEGRHLQFLFTLIILVLITFRCCRIFSIQTKNCLHTISKMVLPSSNSSVPVNNGVTEKEKEKPKQTRIFHDDTMRSFFRRLSFSPDGQLLIVPAGCIEKGSSTDLINTTFIFTRANISK